MKTKGNNSISKSVTLNKDLHKYPIGKMTTVFVDGEVKEAIVKKFDGYNLNVKLWNIGDNYGQPTGKNFTTTIKEQETILINPNGWSADWNKYAKGGGLDDLLEQDIISKIQYYPKGLPPKNNKYGVRYKGKTYTSNDSDDLVQKVLLETNKYAKGGGIEKENAEMVLNNNKQISHHTKELASAVKGKKVPAWVVAKVNRSASDLSDATHYLDGSKFKNGGSVSEKLTKQKIKAKLYKPTGDFFIEDKNDKFILHFTPKDASKNNIGLANMYAESVGKGYYGSAYVVNKNIEHKYAKGGTMKGFCYTIGGL
jgi:hypothetical protein